MLVSSTVAVHMLRWWNLITTGLQHTKWWSKSCRKITMIWVRQVPIANQVCFIHTLDWIMDWTYYRLGHMQRRRKDFLIGGAQSKTTHRVVGNLYNNL